MPLPCRMAQMADRRMAFQGLEAQPGHSEDGKRALPVGAPRCKLQHGLDKQDMRRVLDCTVSLA